MTIRRMLSDAACIIALIVILVIESLKLDEDK
ncbi:hypothetical protein CHIBITOTORO_00230 [Serratia phage vB_SmaM-ChibiTotoro]|nr:hypothetical protein CHIBITOTORO_00230 [Serratia phage vB_SmaM-ChibiTotoro]